MIYYNQDLTFREWLNEGKTPKSFDIATNDEKYNISRSHHITKPRGSSNMPRDAVLKIKRYQYLFDKIKIPKNSKFAIVWNVPENEYGNGIFCIEDNNRITIVTAIIGQKKKKEIIFKDVEIRFDLGIINWK